MVYRYFKYYFSNYYLDLFYYNSYVYIIFLVHQIEKRHLFLERLMGVVKPEEVTSYESAISCRAALTAAVLSLVLLEGAAYYLYLFLV